MGKRKLLTKLTHDEYLELEKKIEQWDENNLGYSFFGTLSVEDDVDCFGVLVVKKTDNGIILTDFIYAPTLSGIIEKTEWFIKGLSCSNKNE